MTVDAKGRGTSTLKIIGKGAELVAIVLPYGWAVATQKWLLQELRL